MWEIRSKTSNIGAYNAPVLLKGWQMLVSLSSLSLQPCHNILLSKSEEILGAAVKYEKLAKRFSKKRAFITGAAGGLGLAFAKALAGDGWTVGITDVDGDALDRAVTELSAAGGVVHAFKFDVSDFEQYSAVAAEFLNKTGGIDVLINNAGIGCGGNFEELSIELWKKVMDINLMGPIYGCKLFIPAMKAQKSGHIVNLASAAAVAHPPQTSPYNVSKAAMVGLTESLFNELVEFNITASVFMPSFIRTNIGTNTIGTPTVKARAVVAVAKSNLTSDWAVNEVFRGIEAGKIYTVRPALIQSLWLFKRLCPETYMRVIADYTRKMSAQLDASAARRAAKESSH
jgi:NAD(P)-dependent dehydrogenase (short-subunit alcohol dehydrogenase family)